MNEKVTIIQPPRSWASLGIGELWDYRELIYFLIWRELKGRYRQMALGPLWLIMKPLAAMVVFTIVFGRLAKIPSEGVPYPLFVFSALIPWHYFSSAAASATNSLVGQLGVISKVYFPRMVVPIAAVMAGVAELLASFLVFLAMMHWYKFYPTARLFILPVYGIMAASMALAVGLWLASLSVRFRDVGFGVGYLMQAWLFLSPVIYPNSVVPEQWRTLYAVNPMVTVIEGFRWCLLGLGQGPNSWHFLTFLMILLALMLGAYYFRRTDQIIVDVL